MNDIYDKIEELRKIGKIFVVCTVVNTRGSTPRKAGAKMIVFEDSSIIGTVGGGGFEKRVIENALRTYNSKKPQLFRHDLLHQHSMCCGGTVDVFIEPVMSKRKLYIFGAGHTGVALAGLSVDFQFETVLIDGRKEYMDACSHSGVSKMCLPFEQALKLLPFDGHTFVCIMTYDHSLDRDILAYCLGKPGAYLGMIGSRRKVEITKKMFLEGLGIPEEVVSRVDMPMGIDIGAEGPQEIALSILSKLVAVKNSSLIWEKELQS